MDEVYEIIGRVGLELDLSALFNLDEERMQKEDQLAFLLNVVEETGKLGFGFEDFKAGKTETTSQKIRNLQSFDIFSLKQPKNKFCYKTSKILNGESL